MRVALIIVSLGCGGAERVMATMANYWAEKGWRVTLITFGSKDSDFFATHKAIDRICLNARSPSDSLTRSILNSLQRIFRLRRALRRSRSEAVISFMENTNLVTLLAALGLGLNVVISQRNDPSSRDTGVMRKLFRMLVYPLADIIVVQTEQVRQQLRAITKVDNKLKVIPNPVVPPTRNDISLESSLDDITGDRQHQYNVIALGNLRPEKGFDDLLRAFSRTHSNHPDWRLILIGEGSERDKLLALARELAIENAVFLPGRLERPSIFLQQADLFVLSSRTEGFPNALLEAMACGLPVISTDCPSGPRDIIEHEVDGVLVPVGDVTALAAQMRRLMSNHELRNQYGVRAKAIVERFNMTRVMKMWEECVLATSGT